MIAWAVRIMVDKTAKTGSLGMVLLKRMKRCSKRVRIEPMTLPMMPGNCFSCNAGQYTFFKVGMGV